MCGGPHCRLNASTYFARNNTWNTPFYIHVVSGVDADDPSDAFSVEQQPATINNTSNAFNITLPIDDIMPAAET